MDQMNANKLSQKKKTSLLLHLGQEQSGRKRNLIGYFFLAPQQ